MSLVFINLSAVVGGQEIYLSEIIPALPYNGTKVLIIPEEISRHHAFRNLKETKILTVPSCRYRDFFSIKKIIVSTVSIDDILIFNGNRAIYCGLFVSDRYRKFAIQHSSLLHSQPNILKKQIRIFLYSRYILKRYYALIGVSEHSVLPVLYEKNVMVTYNGVDLKKFMPAEKKTRNALRRKANFAREDVVIVLVGSLNKNKGQMKAIRIMENLPDKFKLVLAGTGPDTARVRKAVYSSGLEKRVRVTGQVEDIRSIYATADMLLLLSQDEGLPLTILEAMASGLPIITTRAGAVPEVLTENQNCLFIARNNPEEAAGKVEFFWKSSTLRKNMQSNNRLLAKNKFSLRKNSRELLSIITGTEI